MMPAYKKLDFFFLFGATADKRGKLSGYRLDPGSAEIIGPLGFAVPRADPVQRLDIFGAGLPQLTE
jgi:hypothetical protein